MYDLYNSQPNMLLTASTSEKKREREKKRDKPLTSFMRLQERNNFIFFSEIFHLLVTTEHKINLITRIL